MTLKPGTYVFHLHQGEYRRRYIAHIPLCISENEKALPLLVMLHGAGGNADITSRRYGWKEKADKEGFVAIFPEGLPLFPLKHESFKANPRLWTDASGRKFLSQRSVDDIGFLKMVLDDIASKVNIDKSLIFFTGFSNGASMAFRVGVEMSEQVAAIAPFSGHLWIKNLKLARPISLLQITGSLDPFHPLDGGAGANPWTTKPDIRPPMQEAVDEWLKVIEASDIPSNVEERDHARWIYYGPGKTGKVILNIILEGQGHEWPGISRMLPEHMSGPSIVSINATDVIWDFFVGCRG